MDQLILINKKAYYEAKGFLRLNGYDPDRISWKDISGIEIGHLKEDGIDTRLYVDLETLCTLVEKAGRSDGIPVDKSSRDDDHLEALVLDYLKQEQNEPSNPLFPLRCNGTREYVSLNEILLEGLQAADYFGNEKLEADIDRILRKHGWKPCQRVEDNSFVSLSGLYERGLQ